MTIHTIGHENEDFIIELENLLKNLVLERNKLNGLIQTLVSNIDEYRRRFV